MMDFKAMVERDNKAVFLHSGEFAELHVVKYDGVTYDGEDGEGIPVVLTKVKEKERPAPSSDHMQGVYLVTATVHIAQTDLCGAFPEQDQDILISDGEALGKPFFRRYKIVTSDNAMGMIILELEAYDE